MKMNWKMNLLTIPTVLMTLATGMGGVASAKRVHARRPVRTHRVARAHHARRGRRVVRYVKHYRKHYGRHPDMAKIRAIHQRTRRNNRLARRNVRRVHHSRAWYRANAKAKREATLSLRKLVKSMPKNLRSNKKHAKTSLWNQLRKDNAIKNRVAAEHARHGITFKQNIRNGELFNAFRDNGFSIKQANKAVLIVDQLNFDNMTHKQKELARVPNRRMALPVYNAFRGKAGHYNRPQAAVLTALAEQKSNLDPEAMQATDPGTETFGLYQWNHNQVKGLKRYAKAHKMPYTSAYLQAMYFNATTGKRAKVHEMKGFPARVEAQLAKKLGNKASMTGEAGNAISSNAANLLRITRR